MISYDENGFLDGKILDWIRAHRKNHKSALDLVQQLNRECHEFISGRMVTVSNAYQLTTIVLFVRLMELYQGVLLTVERGIRAPIRIVFRAFLEAFFHFAAIHKDADYLREYLDQFERRRKTLVNRIRHTTDPGLASFRQPITDELISEVGQIDVRRITLEEVARRAGWHNVYVTVYSLLSDSVHTTAADLEAHLDYDEIQKKVVGFRYGPTDEETLRTVCLSGMTMAEGLGHISKDFSEDRDELCNELKDKFQILLPKQTSSGD